VLRPEPGNRVTAAAIEAAGRIAIRLPLFETRSVAWAAPDPARFDSVILTSANAIRHGGAHLDRLLGLPVHAVGEVTAEAARRYGMGVVAVGDSGAAMLLERAEAAGVRRALHLAGRDRSIAEGGIVAAVVTVYSSDALPIAHVMAERLNGSVAMVQSARAAARLRELALDRSTVMLAAISSAVAEAAGSGWERVKTPAAASTEALIGTAFALAD
jgi:uroporphyrinogen-III synthase